MPKPVEKKVEKKPAPKPAAKPKGAPLNVPELNGKISKLTADQRKKFFELVPESCFNHDGKRKTLNLAKLQDHPEEAKKIVKKVNEWVESNKPKKS